MFFWKRLLLNIKSKEVITGTAFATVYVHKDRVFKYYNSDIGYDSFLDFTKSYSSKHLPRVYNVWNHPLGGKIVEMEKLLPLDDAVMDKFYYNYDRATELGYYEKDPCLWEDIVEEGSLKKLMIKLWQHPFKGSWDLHGGNIMKIEDGTWVITDPWAGNL
ncbi:hypothetical protein NVP1170O_126 [Vibrio phage 1.170.O._10N.261.52.C3]|nr:hypothetical protein NVP1170O_126 [Vibrio phage 1.170.O._10N.261.52.C3]